MSGWPTHPLLYEINTWPWLGEMSAAAGKRITLADVPQSELERIGTLGFDGVWLMGVWERSPEARDIASSLTDLLAEYQRALPDFTAVDVVGSPYAIHRYEVDVTLGGGEALAALRGALCEMLSVIADQCDGVRCDMAMLVIRDVFVRTWGGEFDPPDADFWREAIGAVKAKHPAFAFVGEVYWDLEYPLQQLGFDYTYDKRLYDRLVDGDAQSVRDHLRASFEFQRRLVRFIENHDEPRAVAAFGPDPSRAAAVLALTLPGMRLVHEGQIEGRRVKIPVQLGRRPAEPADLLMQAHYERLLRALSDPLFHQGAWQVLAPRPAGISESYRGFIAHHWSSGDRRRLVIVNWSPSQAQCFLPLELPALSGTLWQLRDLLGAAEYQRHGDDLLNPGLYLDMPPYSCHLFEFQRPSTS